MPWWSFSAPVQSVVVLGVAFALARVLPREVASASAWCAARPWWARLMVAATWGAALSIPQVGALPAALGLAVWLVGPAERHGVLPVLGWGFGGAPGAVAGWWWHHTPRGRALTAALDARFGPAPPLVAAYVVVFAALTAVIVD